MNTLLLGTSVWTIGAAGAALALEPASAPAPGEPERMPRIVVTGFNEPERDWLPLGVNYLSPPAADQARAGDTAALLEGTPGVAVVRNGAQTGLPQLRGLHGDRVKVLVDGMTVTPACPNHMDPPLHYLAPGRAGALLVVAGVTPVSLGGDSLAGTVVAESEVPRLGTDERFSPFGELTLSARTLAGVSADAGAGLRNRTWSFGYAGSAGWAEDYRFPGGRVRASGYETLQHRLQAAADLPRGRMTAEAGLSRARDTGTPALPMDMIEDDGWYGRLNYDGDLVVGRIQASAFYHQIDHLMDNYSVRPASARRMFSPAESQDGGFRLGASMSRGSQTYRLGLDFHASRFDAYQQNADTGARQDTLRYGARDRLGGYLEWQVDLTYRWRLLAGVRADTIWSEASAVRQFYPAAAEDAAAFNARRQDFADLNLDATLALRFTPNAASTYELGLARKNRAPSLLERYLWTPLSASAGQADGRIYLGNLELTSESAWWFAFTADWHGPAWQVKVSPFYTLATDYIQGLPMDRLDPATRKPVLQYQNLAEARLYGVDLTADWTFAQGFRVHGMLSYVRGENLDTDDNLYRIAPLRGRVGLEWQPGRFRAGTEVVLAAEQTDVARYNDEPVTPGYALWNLRLGYAPRPGVRFEGGIENLTDARYADHLGGINRVGGSDVAIGQRLPGPGRWGYVAVRFGLD